jgi:hypothetical protein
MGAGSFPGVKSGRGVTLTPHPPSSAVGHKRVELYLYYPTGRTACTEAQCLHNGALYLLTPWSRVLLEKLTVNFTASQEIPRIYGTWVILNIRFFTERGC